MIHHSHFPPPIIPDAMLADYVLHTALELGERPALVDGVTGASLSYRELRWEVFAVARWLGNHGIGGGDTVAMVGVNQPAWAAIFFGITAAGAAAAPINPALSVREASDLLRLVRARLILTDGASTATEEAARHAGAEVVGWDTVLTTRLPVDSAPPASAPLREPPAAEPPSHRPAVIAFSSGTSGRPKGVVLTHRNLIAAIVQHGGIYPVSSEDRFLAALPFFHIYGLSMILDYGLRHGATIVTMPRYEISSFLQLIERHRVTWLHVAPPLVLHLVSEAAAGADLSSVRHVVSGAAPLDAAVSTRARRRLGVPIGQGYGMTEASPGVTWVPSDGSAGCPAGSVGLLVAGTAARLVDPATGEDTDGPGELWVRGPQVMAGYFDDQEATSRTIDGGWLRTGDIARVDDSGCWWIVDRLKELIKYKGYQVAPAELEALLLEHPAIEDAAVTGVPDLAAGEIPKAWVVVNGTLDATELMRWVADRVAPYKRIRAVEYVDAIPKSPSGKILRRQLRARSAPARS